MYIYIFNAVIEFRRSARNIFKAFFVLPQRRFKNASADFKALSRGRDFHAGARLWRNNRTRFFSRRREISTFFWIFSREHTVCPGFENSTGTLGRGGGGPFSNLILMRYSLGMPETSLSGRNTRIARNVRRSISRCMPAENAVMILLQKHTHPATLYYFLLYYTNTHATLITVLKLLGH